MAETIAATILRGTRWLVPLMDALLALILILILLIHPPKKEEDATPPGQVIVEIRWPDACASDIDLWVKAPGDRPVGYSNTQGKIWNLLRDDLGHVNDLSGLNFEIAYSRGRPDGEYVVNIHFYRYGMSCNLPIPVDWRVSNRVEGALMTISSGQTGMSTVGEEITLLRFTLTKGRPHDLHDVPMPLRHAQ